MSHLFHRALFVCLFNPRGSKFVATLDPISGVVPLFMEAIVGASIETTMGSKSIFNFAIILVCTCRGVNVDHYREQKHMFYLIITF